MIGLRAPLLALALTVASVAELLTGDREQRTLQLVVAVLFVAPLAVRARWPWAPGAVQAGLLVALGMTGLEPEAIAEVLALLAGAYTAGVLLDRPAAVRILALLAVGGAANTTLLGAPDDIVWLVSVFIVPPWLAGRLMRSRREQEAHLVAMNERLATERDRTARLTAEAERVRIAADIRSVLIGGLRDLTETAERLAAAERPPRPGDFASLRSAGAATTAELRRLLGLLH